MLGNYGNFYSENEFQQLYNLKTNFLQYNGIIQAIKKYARNLKVKLNKKMSYPVIPAHINIYLKSKKGCKDFYNLLNVNDAEPSSKIKWEHEYNICSEIWEDIYTSPFKYKYSSILQWFQIRIIHRILPTKKYLYQIKTIDSPICTNCNQEETLTHLLWTC